MDKFLEYYNISKLIKEEVGNLNSLTAVTEIFLQGPDIFMGSSISHSRHSPYPLQAPSENRKREQFLTHFTGLV